MKDEMKKKLKEFKDGMEKAYPGLELGINFHALFPGKAEFNVGSLDNLFIILEDYRDTKKEDTDG